MLNKVETTTPWAERVTCTGCSRSLQPHTYAPIALSDEALAIEFRASLKCSACGQRYHWLDPVGWVPFGGQASRLDRAS